MDARRQHRIIYQTKIRMRAPGRDDSVIARVQNLSSKGMFVTAADLPDAGTEVQCRLTLGGERRTLRGRVAWVRPASPATPLKSPGAGIEFIDLEERDSELLTRLVEPLEEQRRQPVDVWFEGMEAPIRCQAVVVGEGLRLETRLPFMRLHSSLRVKFSQQSPPEEREGILDGVTLEPSPEDGVPFLRIAVAVQALDSARGTIQAAPAKRPVGHAAPLASTVVDPAVAHPAHVVGGDPSGTHKITLHDLRGGGTPGTAPPVAVSAAPPAATNHKRSVAIGVLVGVVLAAAAALWAWPNRSRPLGGQVETERALPVAAPSAPTAPAATETPPPVAEPAVAPTGAGSGEGNLAAHGEANVADPEANAEANSETNAGPEIHPIDSAGVAGEPGPEVAGAPGIAVEEVDGRKVVTVALSGAASGAKEIRYSDPTGVGVTLPKARPQAGLGVFVQRLGDGTPVRVMVKRRGAGSLVRFSYDGRAYHGKLAVEGDGLRLSLSSK